MLPLTAQAIFDKVVIHLHKQNAQSKESSRGSFHPGCAYRGASRRKCAVGVLITSKEYHTSMEGKSVYELRDEGLLPSRLHPFLPLLHRLQILHDNHAPEDWEAQFRDVAFELNLTFTSPWETSHASRY